MMQIDIRTMRREDIDEVVTAGHSDSAFAVSSTIRFYERAELDEWIDCPTANILLVADSREAICGFLYCKLMSYHWALLDNFYVFPAFRNTGIGEALMKGLLEQLQERNIPYLTTLSAVDEPAVGRYIQRFGFQATRTYKWNELFLDQDAQGDSAADAPCERQI